MSEWVSEWQGHLLSCSGQLKRQKRQKILEKMTNESKETKNTTKKIKKYTTKRQISHQIKKYEILDAGKKNSSGKSQSTIVPPKSSECENPLSTFFWALRLLGYTDEILMGPYSSERWRHFSIWSLISVQSAIIPQKSRCFLLLLQTRPRFWDAPRK